MPLADLSIHNVWEGCVLVFQFLLQVYEGKFIFSNFESVVREEHSWEAMVTLCRHFGSFRLATPIKSVKNVQQKSR